MAYEYQSELAKRYIALGKAEGVAEGKAEGVAEGKAEGVAEGKAEGVAEGRAEGVTEGKAVAVLTVLETRGFTVPATLRARILACTDLVMLDAWLARAVTAKSAADVIGP